jgi:ComF family protein
MPIVSFLDPLLALLFPERCGGCGCFGDLFCPGCRAALAPYPPGADRFPTSLADVRIAFLFGGPLRKAVHAFKYQSVRRLARPLGALMAAQLAADPPAVDALVAVPLHRDRLAERGFNQADALAQEIARAMRIPLLGAGLERVRATEQQAHLDARGRADNLRGAFRWQGAAPPHSVAIVDDVLTTGATMGACAEALRAAGAERVYGFALARSRHDENRR